MLRLEMHIELGPADAALGAPRDMQVIALQPELRKLRFELPARPRRDQSARR